MLAGWTFDILATDLNDNSLAAAKAGFTANTLCAAQARRCAESTSSPTMRSACRRRATEVAHRFERVNLNDDSKMTFLKGMDIIFCCNVLIYFDLGSKRKVMQHFYSNLLPGGYMFMGHAESLYQVDDRFHLVHFPGAIGYWKPPVGYTGGGKP